MYKYPENGNSVDGYILPTLCDKYDLPIYYYPRGNVKIDPLTLKRAVELLIDSGFTSDDVLKYEKDGTANYTRIYWNCKNPSDVLNALKAKKAIETIIPGAELSNDGMLLTLIVPNKNTPQGLGNVVLRSEFKDSSKLSVPLGMLPDSTPVMVDLHKAVHVLVAGTSGSGKTVLLDSMIVSLLMKNSPDEIELHLVDTKRVGFNNFYCEFIKKYYSPVAAISMLHKMLLTMEERYKVLSECGCADIDSYNRNGLYMKPIFVFVDEFADLILQDKIIPDLVAMLAQKGRAAGIHLILATQYPTAQVIPGLIKTNMPTKICLKVPTTTASVVALGHKGAEKLCGYGDMIYQPSDSPIERRLQAPYVDEVGIRNICYKILEGNPELAAPQQQEAPAQKPSLFKRLFGGLFT